MVLEVAVTRRGQTTIPIEVRRKLGIEEGTRLHVEMIDGKVVFTKIPSIFDLAGTSKMSREQAFKALDAMREEEQCSSRLATFGRSSLRVTPRPPTS